MTPAAKTSLRACGHTGHPCRCAHLRREAREAGEDALRADLAALREELRLRPTEDALRASNAILHKWRAHAGEAKADRDRWKARAEAAEFGWAAAECDLKIAREELARVAENYRLAASLEVAP